MTFLAWFHVAVSDSCYALVPGDSTADAIVREQLIDRSYPDFNSLLIHIDTTFASAGYPFYQISREESDTCVEIYLHSGNRVSDVVEWKPVANDSTYGQLIRLDRLARVMEEIVGNLQNGGYPFSEVIPMIQSYRGHIPVLVLDVDKGPLIVVDSLIIKSENPPRLFLIQKYAGLKLPFTYSLRKLEESVRRLETSGLVEITAPASVLFSHQGSTLYMYINRKQRVFADVIIGVNSDNQNRAILTGEVNLALKNVFGYAEAIDLQWRAPGVQQQLLNLKLEFPFVFRSAFGWNADVRLFRQDSTFATFTGQVSATYFFSPSVTAGIGALRENSSVPGVFQPGVAAFSADYSFFKLQYRGLNGRGLYRQGVNGSADFGVGQLRRELSDLNRFKIQIHTESEYRLHSNHKWYSRFSILHLEGSDILLNESFRTGGIGSIRGFNEWLFFTSSAVMGVMEYRYFLDADTYMKGFYDAAWQRISQGEQGYFQGAGAGLAIPVGTGLFHIDVAVGKFPDLPINVRDTRLHIGYVANF